MSGPLTFEEYEPKPAPQAQSPRELQIAGSTEASQAQAEASRTSTTERQTLLPARARTAEAQATIAEIKAEQAKIALAKAKRMQSSLPPLDKLPEARTTLLREIRNLAQAKELSKSMFGASGIGHTTTSLYGGSPAATVNAILAPILANEAFTQLSEMRAASPTGGALGNVTERELDLLKASEGFIDPTASDEAFQQGVDDLIGKRIRVLNRMGVDFQELANVLGRDNIEQFAPQIEGYRFRAEDEEGLNEYVKKSMADGSFDPTDFAALMGQAYYQSTGNRPDEAYIQGAFESGVQILEERRPDLGGLAYQPADESARESFLSYAGGLERPEIGLGEALGGAALNFVPSTFELAADTVKALTLDLPETLEGTAKIIAGATGLSDDASSWEAVKDYYVDRYGSYDGFKRALREDPAAIVADVAGIATGGALIAAKTAGTAGKLSRIAALSNAAKAAEGFGAAASKLDPLVMAAETAKKGANIAGATAEGLTVALPAKLAGVTSQDVRQAFDAGRRESPEFTAQMTGTADVVDPIAKAKAAVGELYATRSQDYTRRMNRLKRNPETLSFDDVEQALEGVRKVGRHKGIDISGASGVWNQIDAKFMEFFDAGLNTVEDFDAMKRAVGGIRDGYAVGTPEYKVANDVYKSINKTITDKAPVYADIMKDYRLASDTLSDITSSLSTGAASADTTLNKLRRSASGRATRGDTVLNILENTQAGKGLGDMLAGQAFRSTEPSTFGTATGTIGTVTTGSPEALASLGLTPRRLGESAYSLGKKYGMYERGSLGLADLPPVRRASELASKYGEGAAQGVRTFNPLIQAQVDPLQDITEETKQRLFEQYVPVVPELLPSYGGPQLESSTPEYSGPMLPVDETGVAEGAPSLELNGRSVEVDPVTNQMFYTDTGELVEGYAMGGLVRKYGEGGEVMAGDRLRQVGKGALFGFGDEAEAAVRSVLAGDLLMRNYPTRAAKIRDEMRRYEEARPYEALAYEAGGMLIPAVIPGGQGASAARLAALAARNPRLTQAGLAVGQGALYGAGTADSVADIPRSMAEESVLGGLGYGVTGVAGIGLKKGAGAVKRGVKKGVEAIRRRRRVKEGR
jgi:hypothetical protein